MTWRHGICNHMLTYVGRRIPYALSTPTNVTSALDIDKPQEDGENVPQRNLESANCTLSL